MAMSRLACVLGALVVVAACGSVSAHGNPVFPVPPVPSLNLTHAMQVVSQYHDIMQTIVPSGDNKMAPQATKLLYQTGQMLTRPVTEWSCGCEIAYTLLTKVNHVMQTVTAGPQDDQVPTIGFTCTDQADCPGVLSSCMIHNTAPYFCKRWVYCGALPDCPQK